MWSPYNLFWIVQSFWNVAQSTAVTLRTLCIRLKRFDKWYGSNGRKDLARGEIEINFGRICYIATAARARIPDKMLTFLHVKYRQTSCKSRTFVGDKIVDHSDIVGASPVDAALTTPRLNILDFNGLGKDNCKTRQESLKFWDLVRLILDVWL